MAHRPRSRDLAATVNDLAAAYLGGPTFRQLHGAGRVSDDARVRSSTADAMFGWHPAPWCAYGY